MDCPVIPVPISVIHEDGTLELQQAVDITCSGDCAGVGELLAAHLRDRLAIAARSRSPTVG